MKSSQIKRYSVLGVLFFLPVAFLLMLYPAKHNYEPLNIVFEGVEDIDSFYSENLDEPIRLKDYITVVGFLGKNPLDYSIAASNLKELVYDKFRGFKKFQIVIVVPDGTQADIKTLKSEINTFEDLKFWHYVYGTEEHIKSLYTSLKSHHSLNDDLASENVFIIDKDLNQRGRIDGREKREIETNKAAYSVYSYNCIDVGDIKNKMSDDMRILFTEYRQKRKGNFDSNSRRVEDLKPSNE